MTFGVEHGVTALVASVTGVGTYLVQSVTGPSMVPFITLTVTLVSAIVAGAVAWGVLKADHRNTKKDVEKMSEMMLEVVQRLSRIESKLER